MKLLIGCAVLFLLIVTSRSESCKEDKLRECLTTLQKLLEDEYSFVKRTEDELNDYCLKVQKESGCLKDAADICQKEYRLISALSATLFNHLNQVCGPGKDRSKVYLNMLPCFESHESEFKKCERVNLSGKHDDPQLKDVCLDMKSMLCVADASKKYCDKDGKSFAELLEFGIKESFSNVCSGAISFKFTFSILLLSAFILLMTKHF